MNSFPNDFEFIKRYILWFTCNITNTTAYINFIDILNYNYKISGRKDFF